MPLAHPEYKAWLEPGGHPEFVAGGMTRDELVHRAVALAGEPAFQEPGLMLATQDRGEAAAMLLAAAARPDGPVLVVPYSLSPRVLEEVAHAAISGTIPTGSVSDGPRGVAAPAGSAAGTGRGTGRGRGTSTVSCTGSCTGGGTGTRFLHLYTGGTTGQPKAWTKSRENLFGEAGFLASRFGIGPGDTILAAVPPYHIYGLLFSVLLPMKSGARVVAETPFLPRELEALAGRFEATVLIAAPAHYRALAAAGVGIPGLRLAFSSGGFLEEEDGRRFGQRSGTRVVEVYGSTETGGIATRCRQDCEEDWTPFPVVEWGVDGERLCVRSPFLSPDLERRADGMFVTGDRVQATVDGRFQLLGRADGVVKVGGRRVVLEDVRRKLLSIDGIQDALVIGLPLPGGRETEVVALVVGDGDEAAWRHAAADMLEPAERPRRLVRVESLPLTPAGKPDMDAARRIAGAHSEQDGLRG